MDINQENDFVNQDKKSFADKIRGFKDYIGNHPFIILFGFLFAIFTFIISIMLYNKGKGDLVDTENKVREAFCKEKPVSIKLYLKNEQLSEEATIKIWSIKQNDSEESHKNNCENNGEICFEICENDKEIFISVVLLNKEPIIKSYSNISEIPQNLHLDE